MEADYNFKTLLKEKNNSKSATEQYKKETKDLVGGERIQEIILEMQKNHFENITTV